ncbi:MAG: hypothetical protein ABFD49_07155 [Armatimonadota bacterium]|nr:hypothetical protein [bacterium]
MIWLNNNIFVRIGDVDLTPEIQSIWEDVDRGHGTQVTKWRIQLIGDTSLLTMIDASQELIAEAGPKRNRVFTGFITATDLLSDGAAIIWAQDRSLVFQESRMGARFGDGFTPQEILYMVAKSGDPDHVAPENFHGLNWRQMPRMFVYIVPLPSIQLTSPEAHLLKSRIYLPSAGLSLDDEIIKQNLGEHMDDWNCTVPRLLTHVRAQDILQAFDKGRGRARRILDWLSLESDRKVLAVSGLGQQTQLPYRREMLLAQVSSSEWAYVREIIPLGPPNRYWLRWFSPHRKSTTLKFPGEVGLFADVLGSTAERLAALDADLLTSEERSLLNALHALRRASHSSTEFDALVSYWEAVEYLLSGFSVDNLATKEEIRAMESAIANVSGVDASRKDCLVEAATRSIRNVNNVPLRTKWNAFCNERKLSLSPAQEKFLWEIRKQRNNAQHGRLPQMTWSELDKLSFIVQRAITAQIFHLQANAD